MLKVFLFFSIFCLSLTGCNGNNINNKEIAVITYSLRNLDSLGVMLSSEINSNSRLILENKVDSLNKSIFDNFSLLFSKYKLQDDTLFNVLNSFSGFSRRSLNNGSILLFNWDSYLGGKIPYYNSFIAIRNTETEKYRMNILSNSSSSVEIGINYYIDTCFIENNTSILRIMGNNKSNTVLCIDKFLVLYDVNNDKVLDFEINNEHLKYLYYTDCNTNNHNYYFNFNKDKFTVEIPKSELSDSLITVRVIHSCR
jgi:hypothetical protein